MEQTISPRQLRRWFGRVALTLLITFVVSQSLSYLSVQIWMTFVGWTNYTILMFLNDFCVYVPSILLIPLLLRSLPQQPPAPVNPLSGQEKFLAVVFSLGSGYLFSYVTLALIHVLEGFVGQSSGNGICPAAGDRHFDLCGGGSHSRGVHFPPTAAGSGAYLR